MKKLYNKERDTDGYDNLVMKHMMAMTAEGLHSKAAIAVELAYRDWQIEQLREELRKSYTLHYQVLHDLITRAQQNAYLQKLEDDEFHEAVIGLSDSLVSTLEGYARKALEETK